MKKIFKRGNVRKLFCVILALGMIVGLIPHMPAEKVMAAQLPESITPVQLTSSDLPYHKLSGGVTVVKDYTWTDHYVGGTVEWIGKAPKSNPTQVSTYNGGAVNKDDTVLFRIPNSYNYNGKNYDVYIKITTDIAYTSISVTPKYTNGMPMGIQILPTGGTSAYSSSKKEAKDFDYELWLQDGNTVVDSNKIPFAIKTVWMAGYEYLDIYGNNDIVFSNYEDDMLVYDSEYGWHSKIEASDTGWGPGNRSDRHIFVDGHSKNHSVLGGYYLDHATRPLSGGGIEFTLGSIEIHNTNCISFSGESIRTPQVIVDKSKLNTVEDPSTYLGDHFLYWISDKDISINGNNRVAGSPIYHNELVNIDSISSEYSFTAYVQYTVKVNNGVYDGFAPYWKVNGTVADTTLTSGSTYTLPGSSVYTNVGYTFAGWTTSVPTADSTPTKEYSAGTTLNTTQVNDLLGKSNNGVITLYAVWTRDTTKYAWNATQNKLYGSNGLRSAVYDSSLNNGDVIYLLQDDNLNTTGDDWINIKKSNLVIDGGVYKYVSTSGEKIFGGSDTLANYGDKTRYTIKECGPNTGHTYEYKDGGNNATFQNVVMTQGSGYASKVNGCVWLSNAETMTMKNVEIYNLGRNPNVSGTALIGCGTGTANLILEDCYFHDNTSAGGVFVAGNSVTQNAATPGGGDIIVTLKGNTRILNNKTSGTLMNIKIVPPRNTANGVHLHLDDSFTGEVGVYLPTSNGLIGALCSSREKAIEFINNGNIKSDQGYKLVPTPATYNPNVSGYSSAIRVAQDATITFNVNGGTGTLPTKAIVDGIETTITNGSLDAYIGAEVVLPGYGTLDRDGYALGGWNTNTSGTGTNYVEGAKYTITSTATTLYAKWNQHVHVFGSTGESRYTCNCGYVDNDKHLEAVKEDAKARIDEEVGTDTSENVKEAADAAKEAIDAATNLDDVSDELEEGIAKIAELQHKNVLDELKRIAKEEIDDEVGTDTSENVKEAAEAAKAAIDAATTKEEIEAATDNGINAIEAAKKVNYRHKLAKDAAKAAIDAEVGGDTTPEVLEAAKEAKAAIDAATDEEAIADAEIEGIAKIAELRNLIVLDEVKKVAKEEIDYEVGTDTSDNVKEAAEAAKTAIDEATTIEEVEAAMNDGIKAIEIARALNAGKIENKTNPEENFGGADVELNVIEIVRKFKLTEEELVRVENGEDIHVKLEVKAEEADNIVAAEKEVIEKKLESGEVIGQYLDVSLFKIVGTDKSKITNTNGTITIEITIPAEIKKAGTDYFIVRVHNGVAEKLTLTPVSGDTYSFETDRFSTYAIGYKTAASVEAPQTGDANNMVLWLVMMMATFVIMGTTFVAKKRA